MRLPALALAASAVLPSLVLAQAPSGAVPDARDAWVLTATNGEGDTYFVAPYRIRQMSDDRIAVWVKTVYGRAAATAGAGPGARGHRYSFFRYEYDCAARTSTLLRRIDYREDGTELAEAGSEEAPPSNRRDSRGEEATLLAVCQAATATATATATEEP